jgi:hypothetical protein
MSRTKAFPKFRVIDNSQIFALTFQECSHHELLIKTWLLHTPYTPIIIIMELTILIHNDSLCLFSINKIVGFD